MENLFEKLKKQRSNKDEKNNRSMNIVTTRQKSNGEAWQYDDYAKHLLSYVTILARVVACAIPELKDVPIREIEAAISNISIDACAEPGVFPDEDRCQRKVNAGNSEDSDVNEGTIRFDLKFELNLEYFGMTTVIINVEAQRSSDTDYDLKNRAVYYAARLISSQHGHSPANEKYKCLKPVYTIWLCMNQAADALILSKMQDSIAYGESNLISDETSFINMVFVCLHNTEDISEYCESENHKTLNIIFSNKINVDTKNQYLIDEGIKMSEDMKEDLNMIGSLEEAIRKEGLEKGREEGLEKGREEGLERGREEGLEKGREEGLERGREEGIKATISVLQKLNMDKEYIVNSIIEEYNIPDYEAIMYYNKYSK